MRLLAFILSLSSGAVGVAHGADLQASMHGQVARTGTWSEAGGQDSLVKGRVSVIDGRTLWFPQSGRKIRLAGIDPCELPQWALDPLWHDRNRQKAPSPVPCGPFARAWLKRTIGAKPVECRIESYGPDHIPSAMCLAGGRDLALEMLRVGWARVIGPASGATHYAAWQRSAMAARYGMWATYVLDMDEWRRKAVDRTSDRQPIADFNLLAERESEISPPFLDYRQKPKRTDR